MGRRKKILLECWVYCRNYTAYVEGLEGSFDSNGIAKLEDRWNKYIALRRDQVKDKIKMLSKNCVFLINLVFNCILGYNIKIGGYNFGVV